MRPATIRCCSTARPRPAGSPPAWRRWNGNLYAFTKASGHFWFRFSAAWVDVGATAPAEGVQATKVTLATVLSPIPDNAKAGTVIAKAAVAMTPAGTAFQGARGSSDPFYTFQGANLVLARDLTATPDDGTHTTTVTALAQ